MAQNTLRTMQDDIKKVREEKTKKSVLGFLNRKNNSEKISETKKEISDPSIKKTTNERDNSIESTTETEENNGGYDSSNKQLDYATTEVESHKQDLTDDSVDQTRSIDSEKVFKNPENIANNKQDEELEKLASRIHDSIDSKNKKQEIVDQIKNNHSEIDKDSELKKLISRVSESTGNLNESAEKHDKTEENNIVVSNEHDGQIRNNETEDRKDEKKEIPYWAKLQKTLNKEKNKNASGILPEIIREEERKIQDGGIITAKKEEEEIIVRTEEEKKENDNSNIKRQDILSDSFYDGYMSPENRLVSGKQEFYSSVHKKIKLRAKSGNLERFKDIVKNTEEYKAMTEEEEKKMLKRQITKKYKINLDTLPWKKIFIGSFLFLLIWGVTFAYLLKPRDQQPTEEPSPVFGKNIEILEQKVSQEITATKYQVESINYFDAETEPWKDFSDKATIRLNILQDQSDNLLMTKNEALTTILKNDFSYVPNDFLDNTTEEYNILVFKDKNVIRLGLAFNFNQENSEIIQEILNDWENTNIKKQKIHNVMKTLFVDVKTTETEQSQFNSNVYKNIEIRYINLPDVDTSMDYFIYDNVVFFTTSKDTTLRVINLLNQ